MLGSVGSSYDESYTRVPDSDSSITSVEPFSPVVSSSVVVPEGSVSLTVVPLSSVEYSEVGSVFSVASVVPSVAAVLAVVLPVISVDSSVPEAAVVYSVPVAVVDSDGSVGGLLGFSLTFTLYPTLYLISSLYF